MSKRSKSPQKQNPTRPSQFKPAIMNLAENEVSESEYSEAVYRVDGDRSSLHLTDMFSGIKRQRNSSID